MSIRKRVFCLLLTVAIAVTMLPQNIVLAASIDDSEVFLKQPRHSTTCTYFSAAMMLRRRAILDGNSNWNSITGDSVRAETRASGGGMSNVFTYAGISVASGYFSGSAANKKQQLVSLLNNHKEGVVIYTYGTGSGIVHAVLATSYENGTVYVADPVYHLKKGIMPITGAYLPGGSQDERIGNLKKYWYVKNGSCNLTAPEPKPAAHVHSWKYNHYSEHPHAEYRYCSCGAKEPTGTSYRIDDCTSCFPVGNVSLTRKYDKTGKTVTFYRNSVQNADKYELAVTDNVSYWRTINMTGKSYTLSVSNSGRYYATLTAKNTNTGEKRSASCSSFEFLDTYKIAYNANGGNGAPSEQTKIQNTPLTLSSSIPTKTGHIFLGWASSKSAVRAQYKAGDTYSRNTKITLYAVWRPETYTIRYDTSDCRGEAPDVTITYGDTVTMPNGIVKEFAYLKGWSESKSALEPDYKLGLDYKISKNTTLYPVWGASTWGSDVASSFSGGDGSEQNPYLISNSAELAYLANVVNTQSSAPEYKYYKLTDNINLGYKEWKPIGAFSNDNQYFCGSFDGNGYTVSDMYMTNSNEGCVGLFGCVKDGVIKNLSVTGTIEGIDTASAVKIGSIAGYALNTDVTNCAVSYSSLSSLSVGGQSESNVGAVVGESAGGQIVGCKVNESSINLKKGNFNAGMIAGRSDSDITDCSVVSTEDGLFSTVPTIGSFSIGGLCGYMMKTAYKCTVNSPYFANEIQTSSGANVGGMFGRLDGEAKVCTTSFTNGKVKMIDDGSYLSSIYATGTGSNSVGGITGTMSENAKISDCKYDGQSISAVSANGNTSAGGIAGTAYARESVISMETVGGHKLTLEQMPKKNGYKATWYTDVNCTKAYDFSKNVTSDMRLYAKWEEEPDDAHVWDGSSKEPKYDASTKTYTITNGEELAWISDVSNGIIVDGINLPENKTFDDYTVVLNNDIILNDVSDWNNWESSPPRNIWKPIATFAGTFDGRDNCIIGMYFYQSETNKISGFIIRLNSTVKNLKLMYSYMVSNSSIGAIANNVEPGKIQNCHLINGVIKSGSSAGGITSSLWSGSIDGCSVSGTIEGVSYTGGIVGIVFSGTITNCYNSASVKSTGDYPAGGICGQLGENHTVPADNSIYNCYNIGQVFSELSCGGIVGVREQLGWGRCDVIMYCYNIGNASLIGIIEDTGKLRIENVYSTTSIYDSLVHNDTLAIKNFGILPISKFKSMNNLPYLDKSIWNCDESINNGYPYLKSNYRCSVTIPETDRAIARTLVNTDGVVNSNSGSAYTSSVGGAVGSGKGSRKSLSIADGLIVIADKLKSAVNSVSSSGVKIGYIIGNDADNTFEFKGAYYNNDMVVNTVTNTTGSSRGKSQLKQATFLTDIVGLKPYVSMDNLKSDETAVWVVKNGSLPELYYNCLKDIRISKDIECGTVSADKEQAVAGEIVTISAVPDDGYVLNKIYVNGEEIDGLTFEVTDDTDIYATFAPKTPEYTVEVAFNENASASVVNIDEQASGELQAALFGASDSIRAKDGEEIQVNAVANENYAVDAIYVNNEEVTGTSFIVAENSVVTMDIESLDTSVKAQTYDAENIGPNFATLGGSVENNGDETVRYVRYWKKNKPEEVYVTDTEQGSGEYRVEVMLDAATEYEYQMTEAGEIKTFTTLDEGVYPDLPGVEENECLTSTTYKKLISSNKYKFTVSCVNEIDDGIIVIAAYNENDELIDIADIQCDGDAEYTASVSIRNDMKYVKVFVLNSVLSLKPLGKAEIVDME